MEDTDKTKEQLINELVETHHQIAELEGLEAERKRAEEALKRRLEQLASLNRASQTVTASLELDQVLAEIVSLAGEVVASDYASVGLVNEEGKLGQSTEDLPGVPILDGRVRAGGFANWIICSHQAVVVDNVDEDGTVHPRPADGAPCTANKHVVEAGVKSFVGLPLVTKGRLLGVLFLHSLRPATFRDQLPLLTTFANQVAVAIENARLFEQAQLEIAERKRAEEALRQSERELTIRNHISNIFLTIPDQETYRETLQLILEALESKHGIFGYIDDQDGALVCPSLTWDVWEQCQIPDKDIVFPRETWGGIWGRALIEKKTLYSNAPLPAPEGHIPMLRALVVPIIHQGEVIGILEVANKATDYDEKDQELLGNIAGHIAPVLYARLQKGRQERERKRAEEALRESEERYRQLVDLSPDAITVQCEGRFVFVNPATVKLMGASGPEDLIGKTVLDCIAPEYRDIVRARIRRGFETDKPGVLMAEKLIRLDGTLIDVEVTGKFITYQGKPAIQAITRDITERKRAEEALAQERDLLHTLMDNIPDTIYFKDAASRFTRINRAQAEVLGIEDAGEAIGKTDFDFFTQEHARDAYADEQKIVKSGQPLIAKVEKIRRADGEFRWVSATKVPIRDKEGRVTGIVGISRDITKRKWAEDALRESELQYRTTIDSMGDIIHVVDADLRFMLVNATFGQWAAELELELEKDVIGRTVFEVFPFLPADKVRDEYYQVFDTGKVIITEDSTIIEGKEFITETRKIPIFEKGRVARLVTVIRDITERKRAEEALAAEKERLAVTLRSIGDGVITTDMAGKIVLINKVAEKLTGWIEDEAIGQPLSEVFHIINEKTRQRCENPVEKVLESGGTVGLANHTVLIARDGTERILADSGAPIYDKEGKIIGVVLVFRDITEKRKMEEELLKASKLESVSILAGGIAHDFNNILTAILGNISFAKMEISPEDEIFKTLTAAEKASLRARDLTRQLLTFAKGGAPVKKTTSIAELIKDSASFTLRGSNARCEFSIPDDLWPVEIDEGQISQVINNLVINADQAMPAGGIIKVGAENMIVGAEQALPLEDGKYVRISIEDQGIGIPEDYLSKIFDPYFTTKQKGSGLGLATSYSIINNHEGHIKVESELGVGTTFYVYLPASPSKILTEKKVEESPLVGKGKILVVDDEEAVREVAGRLLKCVGHQVAFARDGAEAIELYKKAQEAGQPFDAVIMDLTIPGGMGGKEAINKLLDIDPEIKAIVSSGYSNDPVMSEFKRYGFSGVVAKPYEIVELSEAVDKVIMERSEKCRTM